MRQENAGGAARDRIGEAARVVAGWPKVWQALLASHVAGPDGRCAGCPRSGGVRPWWPCGLAALAQTAQSLHRAGRTAEPVVKVWSTARRLPR